MRQCKVRVQAQVQVQGAGGWVGGGKAGGRAKRRKAAWAVQVAEAEWEGGHEARGGRAWSEQAWRIAHVALRSPGGNDKTVPTRRPLSCQKRFPLLAGSVCPSADVLADSHPSKLPQAMPRYVPLTPGPSPRMPQVPRYLGI